MTDYAVESQLRTMNGHLQSLDRSMAVIATSIKSLSDYIQWGQPNNSVNASLIAEIKTQAFELALHEIKNMMKEVKPDEGDNNDSPQRTTGV